MLEDMIDKKIAGIAMLPIQRVSNKNTNQVVDAGKPTAKSIYNKVIYKYDSKGNPILNKFGEKEFQQTQQPFEMDFLVPLDRNSVKNEIDQLLPKSKKQVAVNSKAAAERKFKIYRYSVDEITNENTAKNRKSLDDLQELVEKFAKDNSVTVPQDLLNAIEAKRNSFKTLQNVEVLDGTISKYKKLSKNSAARVDDINKLLDETKSELSFEGIDLRDNSAFVKNQLASDDTEFIRYFKKHDTYKNSTALPTVGQINAIQAMLRSGLIDSVEMDDIVTMANASEIIHDGVIRIQYLKVNSDTNAEAKKLAEYQKTIFTLINLTRDIETNQAIANTLESALKDAKDNEVAKAVKNLDLEILSTQNQIDGKFTTDYQRKKLTERLQDLVNFKETLASAYAFIPADVGADIADQKVNEEEGEILLFEIPTVKEKLAIGDIVYSKKRNNNKKYTVTNVTDKNVMLVDENNKKSTVKIDTFDNNYYTSKEMNTGKPDTGYELEDVEKNIINKSQETVDGFMKDTKALDKAKSESDKKKQSDIENDLINQIKSCQ
jgi:hypothetical protein